MRLGQWHHFIYDYFILLLYSLHYIDIIYSKGKIQFVTNVICIFMKPEACIVTTQGRFVTGGEKIAKVQVFGEF